MTKETIFTPIFILFTIFFKPPSFADCDYTSFTINTLREGAIGWVRWSPDGTKIAFDIVVNGIQQIYTMNADGTDETCLTCDTSCGKTGAVWSKDGQKILYISNCDHPYALGGVGGGMGQELHLMDVDGSNRVRMTTSPSHATNYHHHFSHDGKKVLWTTTKDWTWDMMLANFIRDDQGSRLADITRLTHDLSWYESHGFSPDDRKVIFTNSRHGYLNGEIYTMDLENGSIVRLTHHPGWDEHAHFSPDGIRISWISSRHQPAGLERMTGSGLPPIWDFLDVGPGVMIGFINQPTGYSCDLYLMDSNVGDAYGVLRLTEDGDEGCVVADNDWSPDGTRIVFRQTCPVGASQKSRIGIVTFTSP